MLRLVLSGAERGIERGDARRIGGGGACFGEPAPRAGEILAAKRVARLIEHARAIGTAGALRGQIIGRLLCELGQVEARAVGGWLEQRTVLEPLVEGGRKLLEPFAVRGSTQLLRLPAQRVHLCGVGPER